MLYIKLFFTFIKIGIFTIGSGYSMLVLAQRYIVETYQWLSMEEFTDLVAIAEVTPGPVIVNLATFVGTKVAGFLGALCATCGLICIPFLTLYMIALQYSHWQQYALFQNLLKVVRPLAIGLITVAVIKLSRTAIVDWMSACICIVVIFVTLILKVNPLISVLVCLFLGLFM